MSATTAKLTLIANPKTRKDRENNQAYYQEKFFSRKQKQVLKETKRKEEIAWKEIDVRQQNGTNGNLSGGTAKSNKCLQRQNWEYTKESMMIYHANLNNSSANTENDNEIDLTNPIDANVSNDVSETVSINSNEVVESWEDLF